MTKDIDELLENMGEDAIDLNDNYLSREEVDKIYDKTMDKIDKEKQKSMDKNQIGKKNFTKKVIKRLWVAAIAATLVTGTVAYGAIHWNDKFVRFFGLKGEDDAHEASSMEINKSDEVNGVTISAEQVIGDEQGFYLLLKIKGTDASVAEPYFRSIDVDIDDADTYQASGMECMGIDDGVASYILPVATSDQLIGKNITLTLKDYGDEEGDNFVTANKGTWKLSWKLNYKVDTNKYPVNKKIDIYGGTANFDSLVLSPLSVTIKFSDTKGCQEIMKNGEDPNDEVIVNFMDGSMTNSYYQENPVYGDHEISIYFGKIVNPDEIESVTFAGVTVPVTKNPNHVKTVHHDYPDMGYTIDMQKELNDITTTREEDYYDKDINAKGKKMIFTGKIDGVKMDMFTVIMLKAGISKNEMAKKNSMLTYLGYKNGYVYAILYGEPITEEQMNKFVDILNNDVGNIKPRITIYGVKNDAAD